VEGVNRSAPIRIPSASGDVSTLHLGSGAEKNQFSFTGAADGTVRAWHIQKKRSTFEGVLRQQMMSLALNFIPQVNELSVLTVQNE
jgi:hypothetical protein